jgi:hypothetical protein
MCALACVHRYHLGCVRARKGNCAGAAAALELAEACLHSHPAVLHELAKAYMVRVRVCVCACVC